MKKKLVYPLLICASLALTSCTQISISPFKAHTVANMILRNQENVYISSAYTFTYTLNTFFLSSDNNSKTHDITQTITYSQKQMYFRIDTYSVTTSSNDGEYTKVDVNKSEWVYVQDRTTLQIVTEDKLTKQYTIDTNEYVFDDDAKFAFDSYYALLLPRYKSLILGQENLLRIINIMEMVSFENEFSSQNGTSLSQKYASNDDGNLNANLYLNYLDKQVDDLSITGSNSISAVYKNNILIDLLEKDEYVAYNNGVLSSREYNTISSSFKDRFVQIIKPSIPKN